MSDQAEGNGTIVIRHACGHVWRYQPPEFVEWEKHYWTLFVDHAPETRCSHCHNEEPRYGGTPTEATKLEIQERASVLADLNRHFSRWREALGQPDDGCKVTRIYGRAIDTYTTDQLRIHATRMRERADVEVEQHRQYREVTRELRKLREPDDGEGLRDHPCYSREAGVLVDCEGDGWYGCRECTRKSRSAG